MSQNAWAVDELTVDAQLIRQSIGSLIGAAGGTVGPNGLAVTQKGSPDLHILISGGTPEEGGCWIPGFTATTGPYYFQNTASFELAIPASDATNPRIERIVARVYDNAVDSSGKHEAVFEAIKGTAEAGATLGNLKGEAALPKNCYTLAHVLVPAKATSIVTADIQDASNQVALGMASVGAWTSLTLGTKVEAFLENFRTPMVRTENVGATGRIRGALKVKAGETVAPGETLLTLPVGFRPAERINIEPRTSEPALSVNIAATGVMTLAGASAVAGTILPLEGPFTFSLT